MPMAHWFVGTALFGVLTVWFAVTVATSASPMAAVTPMAAVSSMAEQVHGDKPYDEQHPYPVLR